MARAIRASPASPLTRAASSFSAAAMATSADRGAHVGQRLGLGLGDLLLGETCAAGDIFLGAARGFGGHRLGLALGLLDDVGGFALGVAGLALIFREQVLGLLAELGAPCRAPCGSRSARWSSMPAIMPRHLAGRGPARRTG